VAFFNRSLAQKEAAVVIRGQGKSPIVFEGPGSIRTFGRWKQMVFVDLRPLTVEFTALDVLTKDGVRLCVHGSIDAQVVRAVEAATKVVDYRKGTSQIAETAVRASLRERPSSDVVDRLPDIEREVLGVIRGAVVAWGVSVSAVRVRSSI
jgi:regulator of protease activity HflC (stomatin/prohibitin superfamily)